jgi:formyltetrahydrofolate synthetase
MTWPAEPARAVQDHGQRIRISAGAGFLVAITGDITNARAARRPNAEKVDVTPDGVITGLF